MTEVKMFSLRCGGIYVLIGILIVGSMAFSLTNILQVRAVEEPKYGGRIIQATQEPPHLLTAVQTTHTAFFTAAQMFASLVQYDLDLQPHPWLAESWEISSDGLTYTFHLVHNATWHDGEPVTSADVKFTMEEVTIPYNAFAGKWTGPLDSVETPDDYTVVFKLKEPSAVFLLGFSARYFSVVPKHLYEGTDILKSEYNEKPVGCGPFKFKEWVKGDHVTLVKNEDYFRKGLPYLDSIVTRFGDPSMNDLMLENGEIDFVPVYVEPADVDKFVWNLNFRVSDEEYKGSTVNQILCFNTDEGRITGDVNVRRAIAYAIDGQLHISRVAFGNGHFSNTVFAPTISWCYNPNPKHIYEYNVTRANEILDNAGYPKGPDGIRFHLKGTCGAWLGIYMKNLELVAEQLKDVGIIVDMEFQERAVMYEDTFKQHDFDLTEQGYTVGPDPVIGMYRFLTTDNILHTPWTNVALYSNPQVDELAELAAKELDREKRKEYYYEMQDILSEDMPYLTLYEGRYVSAWNKDFENLPSGPFGGCDPMDKVWYRLGEEPAAGIPEIYVYVAVAVVIAVAVIGVYLYTRRKPKE